MADSALQKSIRECIYWLIQCTCADIHESFTFSCFVLIVENHCSRLNADSRLALGLIQIRVLECNMWAAPRNIWLLAGVDLDEEQEVVWVLVELVVVTVRLLRIRCRDNFQRLGRVIREDQRHLDDVLVRNRSSVRDSERVSSDWLARSPHLFIGVSQFFLLHCVSCWRAYVDNLKARLLEELRRLVPEPSFRDSFRGPCRLIDMHAVEGTHWASITFAVFRTGSDDMSQYVYAGWFWAVMFSVSLFQGHVRNNENLLFLVACQCFGQYLFHLFIVTCRDLI